MLRINTASTTLLCALASAPACGGGSDGDSSGGQQAGLTLAITDAATEELSSFTVTIADFQLERKGGAVVGVLAHPAEVDLVTLVDLGEVLAVMSVPPGTYTRATATFDFTNATAWIEGNATPATLLDGQGVPLTGLISLPLQFGQEPFQAVLGKHKLLELDFDLDQSLEVDPVANTIEVESVLVLRVDPTSPKELVAGGALVAVDTAASSFTAELGPPGGPAGPEVEFTVDPGTIFQIDGVPTTGASGVVALEAAGLGTWTEVYGAIDPQTLRLHAIYVEAGTGTRHGGSDFVVGIVTARSSGAGTSATLTVHGRSVNAAHTAFLFNADFTATTAFANTKVVERGSSVALDLDDVNVGQEVHVYGSLAGTDLDATGDRDVIRLHKTRVKGLANGAPSGGTIAADLTKVGRVLASQVQWLDGGTTPPDPDDFSIEVGGLANGLGLAPGSALAAHGFMSPVDDAGADMRALSVTNLDQAPATLKVRDRLFVGLTLTMTAFPDSIELALAGVLAPGEAAYVNHGLVGKQSLPFAPAPALLPDASQDGHFLVKDGTLGWTGLYLTFAGFSDALAQALAGGASVKQVSAVGSYDPAANTVETSLATVVLR